MRINDLGSEIQPFISIVLPVYNEELYFEQCLKALNKLDYPKELFEIITVDNGSSDSSYEIAKKYTNKALIFLEGNVGAVRNFGVDSSKGDVIAFLDSDCLVLPDWLENGAALLQKKKKCVYGGTLMLRKEPFWIEKYWLLGSEKQSVLQKDLLGSCIFIYKNDFKNVSGFDEQVTSGEDTALSNKLKESGYDVMIDKDIGVIHLGNPINIRDFVKRQIWHSENYVKAFSSSIKDKMFWLVALYLSSLLGIVLSLVALHYNSILFFMISLETCAILLGVMRIKRASLKSISVYEFLSIISIDNLYLLGRSIGLLKGIIRLFFKTLR